MCQQLRKWEWAFKGHNKFLGYQFTHTQMQEEM